MKAATQPLARKGRCCVPSRAARTQPRAEKVGSKASENAQTGWGLKALWVAAEQFGNIVGGKSSASTSRSGPATTSQTRMEWPDVVQAIREDYAAQYFISGKGDLSAYAPDALFADPFVSFKGVERFKQNVSNLGGMMEDVKLSIVDWEEVQEEGRIKASWKFSCRLKLPWKPILAAAGSTTHTVDPASGLVVSHYEDWDVDVKDVLKRLLKPGNRMPQSEAEVFMASVSSGDTWGAWQVASGYVVKFTAPVVGTSLLWTAATGSGLPGVVLGSVEGVSYLLCAAGVLTWVVRIVRGFDGRSS